MTGTTEVVDQAANVKGRSPEHERGGSYPAPAQPQVELQAKHDRILAAAMMLPWLARTSSGAVCAVAGYIAKHKIYKQQGLKTFADFARAKLGIRSNSALGKLRRASKSAWEFYRPQCEEVVDRLAHGDGPTAPTFPRLPPETVLAALRRALEHVEDAERPIILEGVLRGELGSEELMDLGRPARSARTTNHARGVAASTSTESSDSPPPFERACADLAARIDGSASGSLTSEEKERIARSIDSVLEAAFSVGIEPRAAAQSEGPPDSDLDAARRVNQIASQLRAGGLAGSPRGRRALSIAAAQLLAALRDAGASRSIASGPIAMEEVKVASAADAADQREPVVPDHRDRGYVRTRPEVAPPASGPRGTTLASDGRSSPDAPGSGGGASTPAASSAAARSDTEVNPPNSTPRTNGGGKNDGPVASLPGWPEDHEGRLKDSTGRIPSAPHPFWRRCAPQARLDECVDDG